MVWPATFGLEQARLRRLPLAVKVGGHQRSPAQAEQERQE